MKATKEAVEREIIPVRSMSEPKVDNKGRTQAEKDSFKDIIKSFSNEEYIETVKLIPDFCLWDELFRRNTAMLQRINQIEEVLGVNMDNIKPIPIETWLEIRRRYEDLEKKYVMIRKLGGN